MKTKIYIFGLLIIITLTSSCLLPGPYDKLKGVWRHDPQAYRRDLTFAGVHGDKYNGLLQNTAGLRIEITAQNIIWYTDPDKLSNQFTTGYRVLMAAPGFIMIDINGIGFLSGVYTVIFKNESLIKMIKDDKHTLYYFKR